MKQLGIIPVLILSCGSLALAAKQAPSAPLVTIQDMFHRDSLLSHPPEGMVWSPDGIMLSYIGSDGSLMQELGARGVERVLVSREKMRVLSGGSESAPAGGPSYIWAPDSKHLLFDSRGQLWLFDLTTGTGLELASIGTASTGDPKFSPDGRYLSYLRDHNLYASGLHETTPAVKVTESKSEAVLNGEVDWVYGEELDVHSNYFWSPDSKHLAYLQMDESNVPEYPIEDWLPTHSKIQRQYYPQPGDPNPVVRLGVVAPSGGKTKWITLPIDAGNDYIPRFGWLDSKVLWIETLDRNHKRMTLYFADISVDHPRAVLTASDNKFLDESYDLTFLKSGILLTGWKDGHKHIYLYSFDPEHPLDADAKFVRQVTSGDWEVTAIKAVDQAARTIYYLSNEGDPRQQQIWAIQLDGSGKHRVSTITGWHDPIFSPNAKFFADTISTQMTPPTIELCRRETNCNTFWKSPSINLQLVPPVHLQLKAADSKTTLYGDLQLPPGVTAARSVPLIVNPYGGPGGPTVVDQWNARKLLFDQVLMQHGFAVLHLDNRGMGGRGRDFEQAAYHNFGAVQLSDQIAAVDQVLAKYPQLDPDRLGWWGWSWGGTFTLYAMTHSSRFRAGVSVAPVTDWRDYDSIYTERYLSEPADDPNGYHDDSVVNNAANLKGRLLLVHGTSDDNVHLENSIQFIQRLIDSGIPYDLQLYPGKKHGIEGAADRTHLYTRILAHFERYLMNPPESHREPAH